MTETLRDRLRGLPALNGTPPHGADPLAVHADPTAHFLNWFDQAVAAAVPEPQVMTLSTVDAEGIPDSRPLILRDLDERGWAFASSASQRKGHQLAQRPAAALSFWWQPIMRCVRVRGVVEQASAQESAADLARRSPQAQAGEEARDWTLYRLLPQRVEFWQGSPDRRHTRVIYTGSAGSWRVETSAGS